MKIKYWLTQIILAEYLTKPLKVKVFKIFRDVIMGYRPILSLVSIPVSINEHVVNNGENAWNCFWSKKRNGTFGSLNIIQRQKLKQTRKYEPITIQIQRNEKIHGITSRMPAQKKIKNPSNDALKTKRWE